MSKFLRLPILTAFACLISCNPKTDNGPQTLRITEADLINIPLEQVLSGSDYIPLVFTPESALAESAMFLNWTSGFYLMDQNKKKLVYQFDKEGRFVRTIGNTGKGPGEYTYLSDALITKNGLEILTVSPHTKVYKYDPDGRFIRTDRMLDRYSNSFAKNPENGNYYFYSGGYQHLIQQVDDKSLQPVDSFLFRNTKLVTPGVQTFSSTTMGSVLFYQTFDDRIFGLDRNTIQIRYRFDVGRWTPKYEELDQQGQMKIAKEGELWFIYKALENSKWLYLLISKQVNSDDTQSQFYSLLYEKKRTSFTVCRTVLNPDLCSIQLSDWMRTMCFTRRSNR
ncbi:MAG: 6-bladed beta-propeller [Bacteroidales bacterium]